jgi:hypothetical protein
MAGKQQIDDWEEISDTYSVISLPSSDDEAILIPAPAAKKPGPTSTPPKQSAEPSPDARPRAPKPDDAKTQQPTCRQPKTPAVGLNETKTAAEERGREGKEAKAATLLPTAPGPTPPPKFFPVVVPSRREGRSKVTSRPRINVRPHAAPALPKQGTPAMIATVQPAPGQIANSAANKPLDHLPTLKKELEKLSLSTPSMSPPAAANPAPSSSAMAAAAPLPRMSLSPFLHVDILDTDLARRRYYKPGSNAVAHPSPHPAPVQASPMDMGNLPGTGPRDLNPVSARITLRSVEAALNQVTAALESFATSELRNSRVHDLVVHCNLLKDQVRRLFPILDGYSTFWKSRKPAEHHATPSNGVTLQAAGEKPIPLPESLFSWMTVLGGKLDEVKAQIQEEKNNVRRSRVSPTTMLGPRLEALEPSFVTLTGQMVDLLPIMEM